MQAALQKQDGWGALIVLCFIATMYALSAPIEFVMHDAAAELFHAQHGIAPRSSHLLTTPWYSLIYTTAEALNIAPFYLIELLNCATGVLAAAALLATFRAIGIRPAAAYAVTLCVAFSHAYFSHATTAETGIHPQLFLTLSLYWFVSAAHRPASNAVKLLLSAGCFALAVGFALNIAIFFPVYAAAVWFSHPPQYRLRSLSAVLATFSLTSALLFLPAAASLEIHSAGDLIAWLTSHGESERLSLANSSLAEMAARPIAGFTALWIHTGDLFTVLKLLLRGESLHGNFPSIAVRAGSLLLGVGLLSCLAAYGMLRALPLYLRIYSVGLVTLTLPFAVLWLGSDPQFWLPTLPAFALGLAAALHAATPSRLLQKVVTASGLTLAACFFITNIPRHAPSRLIPHGNALVMQAKQFAAAHHNQSYVVLHPGWGWIEYIAKVAEGATLVHLVYEDTTLAQGKNFLPSLQRLIDNHLKQGRVVFIEGLDGAPLPQQFGAWQMVANYRGSSRDDIRDHLTTHYRVQLTDGGLYQLKRLATFATNADLL